MSIVSVIPPSSASAEIAFCLFKNKYNKKNDNSNEFYTKMHLVLLYNQTQGVGNFNVDSYQKTFVRDMNQKIMHDICLGLANKD